MRTFAPGEIVGRYWEAKQVERDTLQLDYVLFINYIFYVIEDRTDFTGVEVLSLDGGKLRVGKALDEETGNTLIYVLDRNGRTQFLATLTGNPPKWRVDVCESGDWTKVLEYAFDKVRTTKDATLEDWRAEYPAISIAST